VSVVAVPWIGVAIAEGTVLTRAPVINGVVEVAPKLALIAFFAETLTYTRSSRARLKVRAFVRVVIGTTHYRLLIT
jgi:hypothetical protein